MQDLLGQIMEHVGALATKSASAMEKADEECEREPLEEEEEEEQEEEMEITAAQRTPRTEVDWAYHSIFHHQTAVTLANSIGAMKLVHAVTNHFERSDGLNHIQWDLGGEVYVTHNFIETHAL